MLKLPRFSTIGHREINAINRAMLEPLSGYIGGVHTGGYWVERLSEEWRMAFKVPYAVPCNSATSGLLAACIAAGVGPDVDVVVTNYSMSATAACAIILGARVTFIDIEPDHYGLAVDKIPAGIRPNALIVTNLFGHPADLHAIRAWCDERRVTMIEDNAQAPFAMDNGKLAGTIGHMGVFSLNVHKHIQCGEGGVVVTRDEWLGEMLQDVVNHGELRNPTVVGLNLRMTEPIAAIAVTQLKRAQRIIQTRVDLANEITILFRQVPEVIAPFQRKACRHVYYVWAGRISKVYRDDFVRSLNERGFPIKAGYVCPLTKQFGRAEILPVTDQIEREIMTFEVCAYDPTRQNLSDMREIIARSADEIIGPHRSKK